MNIGDTLYRFDENRRVYDKPLGGRVIYAEHFVAETIVGETKFSWLIGHFKTKANKKTLSAASRFGCDQYYTAEGRDDQIWRESHRHSIRSLVDRASAAQLRQIAAIVGYNP